MATVFTAIAAGVTSAASSVGAAFGFGSAAAGAGTAAAGSAAASTAAAGAGAAASGFSAGTALSTISGVLSAGSALAAIGQGVAASKQAKLEAQFAETQALQEEAAGAAAKSELAREYEQLTGEQRVIQLANGLDIGVGTPVSVAESQRRLNERNLSTTRANASNRAAMSRLRSRGLMTEARSSLVSGFGRAAEIGANAYQLLG